MAPDNTGRINRRTVIKSTGALAGAGLLAGCSSGDGGDGGSGSSGSSGSSGGSSGSGSGSGDTQETTSKPSYSSNIGQVGFDLSSIPHTAAIREILPSNTGDRMTGSIKNFSSGTLQLQSLVSGDIDFYTSAPGNPYQAQIAGNDLAIVATKIRGTDYVMAVREDVSGFEAFANSDLSFGISSPGSLSQIQPVGVFENEGVDSQKVNWVKIGGSSDRTKAVASGNIDGTAIHIGQFKGLQAQGVGVKSLGLVKDYFPDFIQECLVTRNDWLSDPTHKQFTQDYVNALYQANKKAMNDFEWVYEMAQKYQASTIDKEDAKSAWDLNANTLNAWPYKEKMGTKGYTGVADMMAGGGLIDKSKIDISAMIKTEFTANAASNLSS